MNAPKEIIPAFKCKISALTETFYGHLDLEEEQAFFVNDVGVVEQQFQRWCRNLPRVRPYYAVKCNPDEVLLATLGQLQAGFDCASSDEIRRVLKLGVQPSDIVFANPIKSSADLKFASAVGVTKMTFDNEAELHKIQRHCPNAELILRLLPDDSGSRMRFGSKFGAAAESIPSLLRTVQDLGLTIIGTSFHIGSGCFNPEKYLEAIALARSIFDLAASMGLPPLNILDIGGGFPGNPEVDQATVAIEGITPSFEEFARVIRAALHIYFPEGSGVEIIAEPGRYMATAWSTLFTMVQGKRIEHDPINAANKKFLYYLNDGVYGSFNSIMFDHAKPQPIPVSRLLVERIMKNKVQEFQATGTHSASSPSTFFGPTCDSIDIIADNFDLEELFVGEWLAFKDMGAYTTAAASTFNGMPKAMVYYVNSQQGSPALETIRNEELIHSYA